MVETPLPKDIIGEARNSEFRTTAARKVVARQAVSCSKIAAHVKMPTARRRARKKRKGLKPARLSKVKRKARERRRDSRKRRKNAKKARQARKLNEKVARLNKGENPNPHLNTNIVPDLEKNLEETSETEAVNKSDHVTTRKIDPSDEFPEDNLENEDVAVILFKLLEFYPSRNLVEAYLYSKLGTNKNNHRTILNLWDEVLRGIQDLKDTLKLSIQECQGLDEQTEKINALQREDEVGIKTGPINVELPEKVIRELPEMIARVEKTKILIISAEGCSLATGYGDQMASNKVVSIYQSVNQNKVFEHFGLRDFQVNRTSPRKRNDQMIYTKPTMSGEKRNL